MSLLEETIHQIEEALLIVLVADLDQLLFLFLHGIPEIFEILFSHVITGDTQVDHGMAEGGRVIHELGQTVLLGYLQLPYVLYLHKGGRWLQFMVMVVVPTLVVDDVGGSRVWPR